MASCCYAAVSPQCLSSHTWPPWHLAPAHQATSLVTPPPLSLLQLLDIPDVGLLSSSLDATVRILDLGRGLVANTFSLHRKPVRSLAYSRAFSLVAR